MQRLRSEFGIYGVDSGRICVAALNDQQRSIAVGKPRSLIKVTGRCAHPPRKLHCTRQKCGTKRLARPTPGSQHAVFTQRTSTEPFSGVRQRLVEALQPPALAVRPHADGAARLGRARSDAPARQGIREARVQHQLGQGRRRRRRGAAAGGDRQALLPPAALQALHRRRRRADAPERPADRAGGRAAVGPPLDAAARNRARAAEGPQGLHHRLDRRAHGPAEPGPFHPRRLRRLRAGVHPPHRPGGQRDLGVPAHGAGARRDRAHGRCGRARQAAHDDHDGRPDRRPQEPDRGQQPGHEQEPRLVREQRDLPRADQLSRAPAGASIRASCSTPASWR